MKRLLFKRVKYTGNPDHKSNPVDYGLTPAASPRPDATLCDLAAVVERKAALALLRSGAKALLISDRFRGQFPAMIWAVRTTDDMVFEAKLENETLGHYHGYPLQHGNPFRTVVLSAARKVSNV